MADQVNFFLDAADDPLLPDAVPDFAGGMFSNMRANMLQPNQSKLLINCDIDKLGKLRTRRGTISLEDADTPGSPGTVSGRIVQGLTNYLTKDYNYIVAAYDGKLWQWTDPDTWTLIGQGGVAAGDQMLIYRTGSINFAGGYVAGTTDLVVNLITGIVGAGEKLYFLNNLRTDYYEYTIASTTGAVPTVGIKLEEPGLVFDVENGWNFVVARKAQVISTHPGGYPGTSPIGITAYGLPDGGTPNNGEIFVIKSENVQHKIATHTADTSINTWTKPDGTPDALQADWVAAQTTEPIVFAQGQDLLFFSDKVKGIYAWNGKTVMNITQLNALDYLTGSTFHQTGTAAPPPCGILLWFQNRLIASGISAEPDAIYFSDFFDGTSWDNKYQKVRIGGGDSDPITGLVAWTDMNLLVFKTNSIYIISLDPSQNPNPDDPTLLVASYGVKQLHKLIGCPAPLSAVQVGGGSSTPGSDVFFLDGDKKIHSIRRVMAAETQQEVGTAVSLPIQDVLDTINLDYIHKACAMYHNEHYILGIPIVSGAGGSRNTVAVAYNLLTQSWCGLWSWQPSCFSRRTDLGSYSKLVIGDFHAMLGGAPVGSGRVLQWMDDQSPDEETEESYQDAPPGSETIPPTIFTVITTRAITFGDYYSFKTGLSVEFEFDESVAGEVLIRVIKDGVLHPEPLAWMPNNHPGTFSSLSEARLRLPFTLPATLPASPGLLRKAFDLQRYGTWRELQFQIGTGVPTGTSSPDSGGKLSIRSIRVTGFMDTIRLQTLPATGVPAIGVPDFPYGGP